MYTLICADVICLYTEMTIVIITNTNNYDKYLSKNTSNVSVAETPHALRSLYTSATDNAPPRVTRQQVLWAGRQVFIKETVRPFGTPSSDLPDTATMMNRYWTSFFVFAVLQSTVAFKIPGNIHYKILTLSS